MSLPLSLVLLQPLPVLASLRGTRCVRSWGFRYTHRSRFAACSEPGGLTCVCVCVCVTVCVTVCVCMCPQVHLDQIFRQSQDSNIVAGAHHVMNCERHTYHSSHTAWTTCRDAERKDQSRSWTAVRLGVRCSLCVCVCVCYVPAARSPVIDLTVASLPANTHQAQTVTTAASDTASAPGPGPDGSHMRGMPRVALPDVLNTLEWLGQQTEHHLGRGSPGRSVCTPLMRKAGEAMSQDELESQQVCVCVCVCMCVCVCVYPHTACAGVTCGLP